MWTEHLPSHASVVEVGPRDGLQNVDKFLSTEKKIQLIDALSETGLTRIECTSFVSPKAVPQHADADAVMRDIKRKAGVKYSALVPNERGAERALSSAVDEISVVVSVSESHNRNNVRMSVDESLARVAMIAAMVGDERVILIVLPAHLRLDGRAFKTAFGVKNLRMVSAEELHDLTEQLRQPGIKIGVRRAYSLTFDRLREGLSLDGFRARHGHDFLEVYGDAWHECSEVGLLPASEKPRWMRKKGSASTTSVANEASIHSQGRR